MKGESDGIGLLDGSAPPAAPAKPAAPNEAPAAPQPTAAPPPTPAIPVGELKIAPADDAQRQVTAGTVSTLSAVLTTSRSESSPAVLTVEVAYTSTYPGEGAEWPVRWLLPGKKNFADLVRRKETVSLNIASSGPLPLSFQVEAPVGVRYGDRVELRLSAQSDGYARPARLTLSWEARQSVLAIKTSRGYEREVADTLLTRAEEKPDVLFSLLVPAALRGYVFAEGMSFEGVREMLKGIRKARGLVDGETTLKEVEPLLVPRITVEGFVEGAIVELVAGPFKGEKARVKKIDQAKEEITVELIEAVVPIPVTVRGDHVRMLERGSP
ncbi:MAG: transcription elongation factor Spt5 [Thermoplasmata archaeon]|nr:transcription elongation factor Spt5 [Thermoplasmata archaeon]MCI4341791.1 transcription elongation factor Spt5 [Thermoplasmata archaeon]